MVNFRFFIVSLVAVFLALGIGVIMGSAVIDRAVVDRLEEQQAGIEGRIEEVERENAELRAELRALRETSQQLADEGGQRLLDGTLTGVPVVVVSVRGTDGDAVAGLVDLLRNADADYRGTLWLTDRLLLDDDDEVTDVAEALGESSRLPPSILRNVVVSRLSRSLREAATAEPLPPAEEPGQAPPPEPNPLDSLLALRESGFLDYEPPEGGGDALDAIDAPGLRVVLVHGEDAAVPADDLARPLVGALAVDDDDASAAPVALLVAEPAPASDEEGAPSLVIPLRDDEELRDRISTVDNLDQFAGRLSAVLALVDLGDGRYGHYGQRQGAQRLIPAPPAG